MIAKMRIGTDHLVRFLEERMDGACGAMLSLIVSQSAPISRRSAGDAQRAALARQQARVALRLHLFAVTLSVSEVGGNDDDEKLSSSASSASAAPAASSSSSRVESGASAPTAPSDDDSNAVCSAASVSAERQDRCTGAGPGRGRSANGKKH